MPHVPVVGLKSRLVPDATKPPDPAWRVSTSRHGFTGINRNPVAAETVIAALVPLIAPDETSEAVIVREPGVTSTAEKVPAPLTSVLFGGSTAEGSELVKCT